MIPTSIIIHHTASSRDDTTLEDINAWHKVRFNLISSLGYYVAYHYLILSNGDVRQCRRDNEIGCHCVPNEGKIGVALCGNFEIEMPSPTQLTSLEAVLGAIKKGYSLTDEVIFSHSEKQNTLCCGKNLITWLKLYRKVSLLQKMIQKLLALLKVANKK